jgi:hypothetical protein
MEETFNYKEAIQSRVDNGDLYLDDELNFMSLNATFQTDSIEIVYDKYGFYKDPTINIETISVKEYLSR